MLCLCIFIDRHVIFIACKLEISWVSVYFAQSIFLVSCNKICLKKNLLRSIIDGYYFGPLFFSLHIIKIGAFWGGIFREGIRSKCPKNQNVPSDLPKCSIFGESERPKYIFTIFNQTPNSKHFLWTHWSKCPKVKSSQVKTSQSQNVPS